MTTLLTILCSAAMGTVTASRTDGVAPLAVFVEGREVDNGR